MTNIGSYDEITATLKHKLEAKRPSMIDQSLVEASVLVAVTDEKSGPSLILTRRASHLNLHPGEAAFPGGKQDRQDRSLLHTGLREADEEIGLPSAAFGYLGQLDQHITRSNIKVSPFVGLVSSSVQLVPNLQELDCIYTVPLSFFLDANNLMSVAVEYRGAVKKSPQFVWQQHKIWGVTALIIIDLMNTTFDAGLSVA